MNNIAIITAGGSGTRLTAKVKKQFLEIGGRTILFRTIDKFINHPLIQRSIIVIPPDDENYKKILLQEFPKEKIEVVLGGSTRQRSVMNALENCPQTTELVLIHDGVRPFISQEDISRLIKTARTRKAVIPVSPVINTIKEIEADRVKQTIPRKHLYSVFTPQVFDFDLIKKYSVKALEDGIEVTDDAAILEHYDIPVYAEKCSAANFKITDQTDLKIAELFINIEKENI